ncbi:hypothetical protein U9M48_036505 [Paspalum notatum var. saurae]|uniref:Reverse transcriptase domain-containing protein n=1 Tax=Paspalum notatum var. saurae TaxID=547442 RepID=A0AAQ3X910_PASNO
MASALYDHYNVVLGQGFSRVHGLEFSRYRSLFLVNDAFLVLLRKKDHTKEIKDYRPISLIHSFGKLLTKLLANRLAPRLDDLVMKNQCAFIKGRSIHDCFRTVQLTCRLLHRKKVSCVLLKVEIARAFDSVSWPFLLELLEHIGFPRHWRDWISLLLQTSSTKILLNGSTLMAGAKVVWKARVPPRVRFFAWLALQDRCWTAERRQRHGLQETDDCALCDQAVESMEHLMTKCPFVKEVWFMVFNALGWV